MRIDLEGDPINLGSRRRRHARGPWLQLLTQMLNLAGGDVEIVRHSERPWSSITFSGSRHTAVLAFTGSCAMEAGDDFIAALPDHEFAITRQIVADATIIAVDQETIPEPKMTVEAELLLLEDA